MAEKQGSAVALTASPWVTSKSMEQFGEHVGRPQRMVSKYVFWAGRWKEPQAGVVTADGSRDSRQHLRGQVVST